MDILGIGPLELVFILIILLVVMGPKDIVKSSKVVGKFLRQVMTSPTFRLVQDTSREIRNLPYRLARESGIEELQADLKSYTDLPKISPFPPDSNEPDLGTWGETPGDLPTAGDATPSGKTGDLDSGPDAGPAPDDHSGTEIAPSSEEGQSGE
ncbi:MAG TPA: hypothetical protein VJ768_07040 [Anaerolineales bacterium]|nr:hypothetical protein [Anaerolineales bacterium]